MKTSDSRITHYDILRGVVGQGFEQRVQERINVGWQPYGWPHYRTEKDRDGINITVHGLQTLVKHDAPSSKLVPNNT